MQTLQFLTGLSRCGYSVWRRRTRHRDKTEHMDPPRQETAVHFNYISDATGLVVQACQTAAQNSVAKVRATPNGQEV